MMIISSKIIQNDTDVEDNSYTDVKEMGEKNIAVKKRRKKVNEGLNLIEKTDFVLQVIFICLSITSRK